MSKVSVAELKRRLTVGTKLTLVSASWLPAGQEIERTVTRVQGNAITMRPANLNKPDTDSWLYWKGIQVDEVEGGFSITFPDMPSTPPFVYRWADAA